MCPESFDEVHLYAFEMENIGKDPNRRKGKILHETFPATHDNSNGVGLGFFDGYNRTEQVGGGLQGQPPDCEDD